MSGAPLHPLEEEALRRVRAQLLDAIENLEHPPARNRRRSRRPFVVATAALASVLLIAAAAFVVIQRGERPDHVATIPGDVTDTSVAVPTAPAPTTTLTPVPTTTSTIAPGPRPDDIVAVSVDGRLVVVDASTGTELRQLAWHGDPRREHDEGGPSYVSGVALDRNNGLVYYETCCEPAVGALYVVPFEGGDSTRVADISWPAVSTNGDFVGIGGSFIRAYDTRSGIWRSAIDPSYAAFHPSLSPDGAMIAYERGGPGELVVLDVDELAAADASEFEQQRSLDRAQIWHDPDGIGWMHPAVSREGNVVVAQQCCYGRITTDEPYAARVVDPRTGDVVGSFQYPGPVVDQQYDGSGTWLLVTLADNRVVWFGGGTSGVIEGLYIAAAW